MGYDLKIVGGIIVDGTGAPGYAGDVGVRDGRIVALGDCPDVATRTLDARGAVVTPGFVDLHCHYDGQVSWDADMAPSSLHGVTTCLTGHCGVQHVAALFAIHPRTLHRRLHEFDTRFQTLADEGRHEIARRRDEHGHRVDVVLGLRQQIGCDPARIGRGIREHEQLARPCEPVNAHLADEAALCRRDVAIARTDDHVDARNPAAER